MAKQEEALLRGMQTMSRLIYSRNECGCSSRPLAKVIPKSDDDALGAFVSIYISQGCEPCSMMPF